MNIDDFDANKNNNVQQFKVAVANSNKYQQNSIRNNATHLSMDYGNIYINNKNNNNF